MQELSGAEEIIILGKGMVYMAVYICQPHWILGFFQWK